MRNSRISPDNFDFAPRHNDALRYVEELVIDLKKQLLGHAPNTPITMERLNEWDKYAHELNQCKERIRFY